MFLREWSEDFLIGELVSEEASADKEGANESSAEARGGASSDGTPPEAAAKQSRAGLVQRRAHLEPAQAQETVPAQEREPPRANAGKETVQDVAEAELQSAQRAVRCCGLASLAILLAGLVLVYGASTSGEADPRFVQLAPEVLTWSEKGQYVPVVDELQGGRVVSLFVRLEGPARAEAPLVLLYAAPPRFSFSFRRIVPRLAERGLRVLCVDAYGFGRSERPSEAQLRAEPRLLSDEHQAALLDSLLDSLGLERSLHLLLSGPDAGLLSAQRWAARGELRSVMLLESALCGGAPSWSAGEVVLHWPWLPSWVAQWVLERRAARSWPWPWPRDEPALRDEELGSLRAALERANRSGHTDLVHRLTQALAATHVPVLLLLADSEPGPQVAESLAVRRTLALQHFAEPARLADQLADFIDEIDPTPSFPNPSLADLPHHHHHDDYHHVHIHSHHQRGVYQMPTADMHGHAHGHGNSPSCGQHHQHQHQHRQHHHHHHHHNHEHHH